MLTDKVYQRLREHFPDRPPTFGVPPDNVTVVGRHRRSHRFVCLDMQAKHLANWRAELVYRPAVIRHVHERGELRRVWVSAEGRWAERADTDHPHRRAEEIAAGYIDRGAASQPYTTRPPAKADGQP